MQNFTIDNSGNVGIGDSNPAQALVVKRSSGNTYLDISRASQSQGQVALQLTGGTGGTNWIMYQDTSSDDLRFFGNSATRMTIDSSGNVDLLQSNHLRWKHAAGGTIRASIDADSNDSLMFYTGSSETKRVSIDNVGRLLIGTDSGDSFNSDAMLRLQRSGDRVFQQFKVDADQEAAIFFGDVDDDVECGIRYEPANKNLIFSTGNNADALTINEFLYSFTEHSPPNLDQA